MRYFLIFLLLVPLAYGEQLTDNVNEFFSKSQVFVWRPPVSGNVTSLEIDARIYGSGDVRVSLIKEGKEFVRASKTSVETLLIDDYVELEEGSDIGLLLTYDDGNFDHDDDGIVRTNEGVDITFKSFFFVPLDEQYLCTLWDVYSVDEDVYTSTCYGNVGCCSYLGYSSRNEDYDDPLVLTYGEYGTTAENIVLGRVVFYNGTDAKYSNYDALTAQFKDHVLRGVSFTAEEDVMLGGRNLFRITLGEDTALYLININYEIDEKPEKVVLPVIIEEEKVEVEIPKIVLRKPTLSIIDIGDIEAPAPGKASLFETFPLFYFLLALGLSFILLLLSGKDD